MVVMKLFLQTGPMMNVSFVLLIMTYQSKFQVIPYVQVNRSALCNCGIEAENNYLLESLAACHNSSAKLIMYFTVNLAFTNYINQFNLTEELEAPINH